MIGYNEKKAVQTEEPDIKLHKLFRIYRPKYEKSPKKSEKRKSIRALSCFALVFAALMASVGTSYAKYISEPVTIPPFSVNAAQFAPDVKFLSQDEINNNKSKYGLKDTDVVVGAFNVSNNNDGKQSEVDLSVDVDLALEADDAYAYQLELDYDNMSFTNIDSYGNSTEDVKKNIDYCRGLNIKSKHLKLIVGETDASSGTFNESVVKYGSQNDVSTSSSPPPFALSDTETRDYLERVDYDQLWEDAFTIPADGEHNYTVLVVVDTVVNDDEGNPITFKAPPIKLVTSLTRGNNLTVTVNQAKSKG